MDLVSGRLCAVASRRLEGAPPHRGPATKATPGGEQGLKISPGRAGGARPKGREAISDGPEMAGLEAIELPSRTKRATRLSPPAQRGREGARPPGSGGRPPPPAPRAVAPPLTPVRPKIESLTGIKDYAVARGPVPAPPTPRGHGARRRLSLPAPGGGERGGGEDSPSPNHLQRR